MDEIQTRGEQVYSLDLELLADILEEIKEENPVIGFDVNCLSAFFIEDETTIYVLAPRIEQSN